ncbi:MAG: hypothetical protein ACE5OZ_19660 [Candidatus Heimdallarchaeota archaeon]
MPVGSRGSGMGGSGGSLGGFGRSAQLRIHTLPYRRAGRHYIHRRPRGCRPPRYSYRSRSRWSSPLVWIVGGIILFLFLSGTLTGLFLGGTGGESYSGTAFLRPNERWYEYEKQDQDSIISYDFYVQEQEPIEFLILDEHNADLWDSSNPYRFAVFLRSIAETGEFAVPYDATWYVILYNPEEQGSINVNYAIGFSKQQIISPEFAMIAIGILIILVPAAVLVVRRRRSLVLSPEPTSSGSPSSRSTSRESIPTQANEVDASEEKPLPEKSPVYIYPEKPQYQRNVVPTCFACGELLDEESTICSDCGTPTKSCQICRGAIGFRDSMASCPHCQNEFHLSHMQEWLKVAGECPICRQRLNEGSLITGGEKGHKSG